MYRQSSALLPQHSIAHQPSDNSKDWEWFYVNVFIDRNMFMHYCGGAVGHKTIQEDTKYLLDNHNKLDKIPFKLESEQNQGYRLGDDGEHGSDVNMGSVQDSDDAKMEEDTGKEDGTSGTDSEEEIDGGNEDNKSNKSNAGDDMVIDPKELVDDDLLDEMDKFRYSGLDQVEDKNNKGENDHLREDDLGAEDGENNEWEDDFAHVYL